MATASFGKVVKLNNEMAQKIVTAAAQPPKKVIAKKDSINLHIDASLIQKLK